MVLGVLGEPFLVEGKREISSFGGWRAYTASQASLSPAPSPQRPAKTITVGAAVPYPFEFPAESTALVMIDFQRDFCEPGGFGAALGNDVARLRAAIPGAQALLAAARAAGLFVVHTLEAHLPDLSDCPPSKRSRGNPRSGMRIGDVADPVMGRILVRGEPGNGLLAELAAREGELVLHKPGKGAFCATGFGSELSKRGITHLLIAGVTTEVCVATTMREANDRGYECLLVSDATESYFPAFKTATLEMITAQGGIAGWMATSAEVAAALSVLQ